MKGNFATEVQLLSDVAKAFAESLNLEETLMSILRSLDTHLKLQRGTITLLDPETETINIKVAHGLSERSKSQGRYKVGEGITGRVVQTGEAIIVPDIAKDPRFLHRTKSRDTADGRKIAFFCVPIKLEGKTVGALSVDRQAGPQDDFDASLRLLHIISTMVAQAVKLNKMVESERALLRDENVQLRPRAQVAVRYPQYGRQEQCDAGSVPADRAGRRQQCDRADPRRDRHRQGPRRPRDPLLQSAPPTSRS